MAEGKEHAVSIGVTKMSTQEMYVIFFSYLGSITYFDSSTMPFFEKLDFV